MLLLLTERRCSTGLGSIGLIWFFWLTFFVSRSGMSSYLGRPFVLAANTGQRHEPSGLSGLCIRRVWRPGESYIIFILSRSDIAISFFSNWWPLAAFYCVEHSANRPTLYTHCQMTERHFLPFRVLTGVQSRLEAMVISELLDHASSHLLRCFIPHIKDFLFFPPADLMSSVTQWRFWKHFDVYTFVSGQKVSSTIISVVEGIAPENPVVYGCWHGGIAKVLPYCLKW